MTTDLNQLSLKASMAVSISLISLFCIEMNAAQARCQPSDPFGTNPHNVCPEGFAFAFTQNFESPHYVRGKLYLGKPLQPGFPGVLVEEINGFYTGVTSNSQGLVRITSTVDSKTYQQTSVNQVNNEVRKAVDVVPR